MKNQKSGFGEPKQSPFFSSKANFRWSYYISTTAVFLKQIVCRSMLRVLVISKNVESFVWLIISVRCEGLDVMSILNRVQKEYFKQLVNKRIF